MRSTDKAPPPTAIAMGVVLAYLGDYNTDPQGSYTGAVKSKCMTAQAKKKQKPVQDADDL